MQGGFSGGVAAFAVLVLGMGHPVAAQGDFEAVLPEGVHAVWTLEAAQRDATPTRERIAINGLWRWQPAVAESDAVPDAGWGYFKVPGCWPGITDYMQKDCQTVFAHPRWKDDRLDGVATAWYQRTITIPNDWAGRRIALCLEYVHSLAAVYVDGHPAGDIRFPAGEADLTALCRPGQTHMLSLRVTAMPLEGVMLSYNDTASARKVEGRVARRGLCGDAFLVGTPPAERIDRVSVATSVRTWQIDVAADIQGLAADVRYVVQARITDGARAVLEFAGSPFGRDDLKDGRIRLSSPWKPERLWDTHTPQNVYRLSLTLAKADGTRLDESLPVRFGFREFWIDGRDFYLNGTRIFLSSVPLDNAQVGAAWATYAAARESIERLQRFGINFVYTHNYGCEPGSHLSFEEILSAADDAGMLVAFSQPHFSHYHWDDPGADRENGYARHAAFYASAAGNHPSVVAYSTSHNATGYGEDMNPDLIDGIQARRSEWSARNVALALRAEAIIAQRDPTRIVYHHASGNLGSLHAINFYANFVPIQEMADWFEHWSTAGVKPVFTCEYTVPMSWDWTLYRGWYQGRRAFGSAAVPWEFCLAEWNAQFLGDPAYRISEAEKANLRWEARQFEAGETWHRWDYPHQVGSRDFTERYPVFAMYFADVWPAMRTWGVSANSPWDHAQYWTLRDGVDRGRKELPVDWGNLQRPGFSPDYLGERYETVELAYERDDWIPTAAAQTLIRNNGPLLGYIAGKPEAFTSKDHNFHSGDVVEKQLIVINNSRAPVTCRCNWWWEGMPDKGETHIALATGNQERIPLRCTAPRTPAPAKATLHAAFHFSTGQTQEDTFAIDILPAPQAPRVSGTIALFDPVGETAALLRSLGLACQTVDAGADLSGTDILVVGKGAITVDGPAPDVQRVRDGLRIILFEQTPEVLEKRFGFRVATYGLRGVFPRVPDHPALAGLDGEHLRSWRGSATLVPPRLDYRLSPEYNEAPAVRWCGIEVTRLWRCGNRGNVATALIEKPARGDFLPILDGGFSLQYSPLLEYREGRGMVLFCQMDVTGRTETDPAAVALVRNLLDYAGAWKAPPRRSAVYAGDPAGRSHLAIAGIAVRDVPAGGRLAENDVLVVGAGGGAALAADAGPIAEWVRSGGHVLALGLDEQDAAFLPSPPRFRTAEHIAAYFEPFGADALLAGVGPADVHNAAPQTLPLISGDAAVGDGVLGKTPEANVVFCQLPPYRVGASAAERARQHNLKRTYRRASFLVTRLLANMGVAGTTPLLERIAAPVSSDAGESVVRNGDWAQDADGDGMADAWTFSSDVPGAACRREKTDAGWCLALSAPPAEGGKKAGAMLAQQDVPIRQGQWYRITLRARGEDLEAKSVAVTVTNTATWQSFFEYQRFEPDGRWKPVEFEVQAKTGAQRGTRFQIWYQGSGRLWLADLRVEPIADPSQGRWLDGLYLDVPEAWDDPYRFFRW